MIKSKHNPSFGDWIWMGGEEPKEVEGRETTIMTYYGRKKHLLSIKGKQCKPPYAKSSPGLPTLVS